MYGALVDYGGNFLCENGGLMVLLISVDDFLKVFARVARWIFVSNGGFTRILQF